MEAFLVVRAPGRHLGISSVWLFKLAMLVPSAAGLQQRLASFYEHNDEVNKAAGDWSA